MDISDSEILILVGKIVGESNVKMESKTKIKVIVDDRVSVRSEVFEDLKSKLGNDKVKIEPHRVSSVDPIFVQKSARDKILIYFKSKSGGGSGLGAEFTKQVEGGQAVYAAVAFNKGSTITSADVTPESINDAKNLFSIDDSVENILKMSDPWVQSSVKGANLLYKKFGDLKSKGVVFHRGDKVVEHIENQFKRIKKIEGVRIDINKWSPADIYMATQRGKNVKLDSAKSILELNTILLNNLKSKDIIGVSLKKSETGKPKLKYINVDNTRPKFKYTGLITNKGPNFFSAKDVYLKFDGGEIQFRTFAPTWQGEIKGKYANQGKVSGGPLANIIKRTANKVLTPQRNIAKGNIDVDKFYTYYSEIITGQKLNKQKFLSELAIKPLDWQISKFLGSELLYHVKKSTNKDSIISAILGYASSQSQLSAPYIKLSDE